MEVYKFGGASIKDAPAIANAANIILQHKGPLVVVVSAMGKTTDAFEELHEAYMARKNTDKILSRIANSHYNIVAQLDISDGQKQLINAKIRVFITKLEDRLGFKPFHTSEFHYDQLVSFGELLSSAIVAAYMQARGAKCNWLDVRLALVTDKNYSYAKLDWNLSARNTTKIINRSTPLTITQGFIGGNLEGHTTTFGRDGSDYSASVLAYLLDATRVTVWKDVDGVYNADPRWYNNYVKLKKISYKEAIELAFFGAQIIHPKTIKPLQNKQIPFYVKSFLQPNNPGTFINEIKEDLVLPPVYIRKINQVLISIQPTDFSFIMEDNLSVIFGEFAKFGIRMHLMQNAAISFSACFDYSEYKLKKLIAVLQKDYEVKYNTGLELLTIRHYNKTAVEEMVGNREIFIQQKSRKTVRYVLK